MSTTIHEAPEKFAHVFCLLMKVYFSLCLSFYKINTRTMRSLPSLSPSQGDAVSNLLVSKLCMLHAPDPSMGVRSRQHMSLSILSLSSHTHTGKHTHTHNTRIGSHIQTHMQRLFSVLIRIENCPAKINRWQQDEGVGGATVVHSKLLLFLLLID